MSAKKDQAKSLFLNALEIPGAEERETYLDEHCGDDQQLRQELLALLAHHRQLGEFLDSPPAALAPTITERSITEAPGTEIGPYKLLEQIGEGGFGVVFMAEQTAPVKRKVALKVIKPGMDTREVIARFEAERQALALMDHPNIAKVLDAGATDTGRPFFVMELVRGVPITEYCDEAHLAPRERLELFVTVCHAVQHAHQKGVIHRDIKPTNVLVAQHDDRPVVKVIDFGVAKATSGQLTDKTLFTGFAQVVGTPLYMSPEQASLSAIDIDTRSDIYSLGVLLYELLTGTTPFDKTRLQQAAFEEVRRIIREEEPQKPSTRLSSLGATLPSVSAVRKTEPRKLSQLVRGDLDWIVMKALEKDRARRYDTANGFAADVLRYLSDETVTACPPSAGYRFRKFARRNRAALLTTATVAGALVAGIIGTTWQAIRATHEATRATNAEGLAEDRYEAEKTAREQADAARAAESEQRQIAQDETRRAEENFDKARRAVDEYLSQVTESELLTVPGLQPLREDLLRAALTFYAEFTLERADDPTIQRELASAHFRLGRIHAELGDSDAAAAANNEAIRLYEQLRGAGNFDLDAQVALAWAYLFAQRYDDTAKLCQNVLFVEPHHVEARSLLADTGTALGAAESNRNEIEAAFGHYRQAFELREALVRDDPDNPRFLAQLGGSVNNLGVLLSRQEKSDEALAMYQRAVENLEQAYARAPHSILWGRWLCTSLGNVASTQAELGREQEALASYQRLVAVSRKRAFENPAVTSLRGDQCRALLSLARYQLQLGDTGEAARSFREAREVLENIPRETPDQLYELATVYAALAQPVEGAFEPPEEDVAEQERNIDLALETLYLAVDAGFSDSQQLRSERLFDVIRQRDDFQRLLTALETAAEARRLAGPRSGADDQTLADRVRVAELLTDVVRERPGALRHRATLAATLHSIAVIQTGLKQFDEAEKSFREALDVWDTIRQLMPESQVDWLGTRIALGRLYWDTGRHDEAHLLWKDLRPHLEEFEASQSAGDAIAAGRRLSELIRPIAETYADLGLWEEVSASLAATGADSNVHNLRIDATVRLLLNDEAGYRSRCAQLVEQSTRTADALDLHCIAAACLMAPQGYGDLDRWLQTSQEIAEQRSDWTWAPLYVGLAYYRAGRFDDALTTLESRHDWFMAWPLLAMTCQRLGAHAEAQAWFDRAHEWYLQRVDATLIGNATAFMDGVYPWDRSQFQLLYREAGSLISNAAESDPWQHLIQARGYRLIGEIEKSDAELAASVAAAPDDANVWMARARLLTHWNDPAHPAEADWQRAVELAGDDPLPWIHRGRWYTERGEHTKADADFTEAASLTPSELNIFFEAGWWASTTPEGLSPLLQKDNLSAPNMPEADTDSFTVVYSTPYWVGQEVEFRNAPEFTDADTAYAMTYVYAPEVKGVTLLVGGAASVELRLNGRRIYESRAYRSVYHTERVPVLLRAGRNTLVARVPDPGRSQSLFLRIADNRLDRGLELAQFGLWDEALPLLNAEFAEDRRPNEQVWSIYSGLLSATGDFAANREFYDKVLNWVGDSPNSSWSVNLHASQSCTRAPVPETDIARLVSLVDDGAARASATSRRWAAGLQSTVYFRAERFQEVLDRNQTGGWREFSLRALCWHHLGDATKAESDLARAERGFAEIVRMGPEGPSSAKVSSYAQGLLDILGDYVLLREARTLIAPEISPDDQALHALIAQTRQQLEAADPRLLPFEMALISGGTTPQAWLERGRARALLGQWDSAQADFAQAVAIAPDDPEVLVTRALIYAELDRVEEAMADVARLLDQDADNARSPGWLAARQRLFAEQGQWPKLFERVTKLRPADPDPWISRARYFALRSRWPDPAGDGSQVHDERADLDLAMTDLREAVERGFREFNQPQTDAGWQALESHEDFRELVRETAERYPDDLILLAKLEGHTERICAVAFLPDRQRIVSVGQDRAVRTWDLNTGSVLSTLPVTGTWVGEEADVSADGRFVALIIEKGVRIWDLEHGMQICEMLPQNVDYLNRIRFTPDGTRVITSGKPYGGVLWDASTGEEVQRFDMDDSKSLAVSPDGRLLAMGAVGRVRLFDVETGHVLGDARLPQNRTVLSLAFAPSGDLLACGQMGGHATVIDVDSRQVTGSLANPESGPDAHVINMQFLDEKQRLLITRVDGTLEVWDLAQTKIVTTAASGDGTGRRLAVSPDGHYALTGHGEVWDRETNLRQGNGDYALRLWQLPRTVWTELERPSSDVADAERPIGAVSPQEPASLRLERWERELDQLPRGEFWYSARMRLCREIAADAELFGVVQQLRPDDADLSIARGQVLAQAQKWDEAAEWFGRVIDRRGLSQDTFQSACLHLLTNRPDAYREFCTKLIDQAGDVSDPHVAFALARTCILVPEMAASPEQVVSWAEQAVSRERIPWGLHVLGAACCRAGQYGRAIELLEESTASNWSTEGEALNALVMAIAHQRQGNSVAAAECLDRARALMAGVDRPPPQDWMEFHVLVREAEGLIEAHP